MDRLPDGLLLHRFLDGDELAFRALYRRHTPRLRSVILRMLGARGSDAEDALQETWLSACRGIHAFRGDAQFATWLTTIGIRVVQGRLRRSAGEATVELPDDVRVSNPPGAHHAAIDLERAIARLPDHQRVVLVLHDVEGFTHEEIGRQLEVATGTSKATLSRARRALRGALTEGARHGV
jgi:RNA polymerase sigma-70 factor (ECF subfamily)